MSVHVLHDGTVKSAIPYVKYNGSVVIPTSGWAKTGGELKQIWPPTSGDTVYIYDQATLEAFRDRVNAGETSLNALVIADFSLSGGWTPIANYASDTSLIYTGTFDGGGHTISGLSVSGITYAGFFGYIGTGGVVKNLTIADGTVSGIHNTSCTMGGIVGWNYGTVENCTNSGTVSGTRGSTVGGIVGRNDGTVSDSTNEGNVTNASIGGYAGGIVGRNYGTVENCTNSGTVSGSGGNGYAGGIVGYNDGGTVENNTNTGTVTGANITVLLSVGDSENPADSEDNSDTFSATGGIIGYNEGGAVSDNTNSGSVSGGDYTGDIIGYDAPVVSDEE